MPVAAGGASDQSRMDSGPSCGQRDVEDPGGGVVPGRDRFLAPCGGTRVFVSPRRWAALVIPTPGLSASVVGRRCSVSATPTSEGHRGDRTEVRGCSAQHGSLLAQDQQLHLLGRRGATEQHQLSHKARQDQVQQSYRHDHCLIFVTRRSSQVTSTARILKTHRGSGCDTLWGARGLNPEPAHYVAKVVSI